MVRSTLGLKRHLGPLYTTTWHWGLNPCPRHSCTKTNSQHKCSTWKGKLKLANSEEAPEVQEYQENPLVAKHMKLLFFFKQRPKLNSRGILRKQGVGIVL